MRESDAAFASMRDGTEFETWEDLNLYDRCITRGMPGAMVPGFSQLGQWLGDSRAHWEGETLVVETTNLTVSIWGPASGRLEPHQRLTRQDVGTGTRLGFSDPHLRLTLCLSSELSVARERASEAPASPTV